LIAQDNINFRKNAIDSNRDLNAGGNDPNYGTFNKKKRGKPGQKTGDDEDSDNANVYGSNSMDASFKNSMKKLRGPDMDFLEVGSISWSMLIAIYFLTLHDDSKDSCITFDSIQEMLDVLSDEFGDMIPLVSSIDKLIN